MLIGVVTSECWSFGIDQYTKNVVVRCLKNFFSELEFMSLYRFCTQMSPKRLFIEKKGLLQYPPKIFSVTVAKHTCE